MTRVGRLSVLHFIALALAATLGLTPVAGGAHTGLDPRTGGTVHCGTHRKCIEAVAVKACATRHDAWHCRIVARERARAAAAKLARSTACGTVACDRAYLVSLVGPTQAACAENIIAGEDATYDPTLMYGGGHGWGGPSDDRAGGIPQAKPMQKMEAAGPDWATDPRTQLRWLVLIYAGGGAGSAYSSPCAAWATKQATGTY